MQRIQDRSLLLICIRHAIVTIYNIIRVLEYAPCLLIWDMFVNSVPFFLWRTALRKRHPNARFCECGGCLASMWETSKKLEGFTEAFNFN